MKRYIIGASNETFTSISKEINDITEGKQARFRFYDSGVRHVSSEDDLASYRSRDVLDKYLQKCLFIL